MRNERGRKWAAFNLRDLWSYRELLYFLVWRDLKVRYKQTALGVAWVILQPLGLMLLFTLLFNRAARIPSDNIPYPLFAYAGLLVWTFFANSVTSSSNSLIGNPNLITKVYFPRVLIPVATVGAGMVDLALASVVLVGLLFYYRVALTWGLLMLPVLIALAAALALGVGVWTAALNVKYRDLRYALPFLIQLWLFASPVIYPSSLLPEKWRWALALNPLTGIIEGTRAALFGHAGFDWTMLAIAACVTLALLVAAAFVFRGMEREFADLI